jgi:hypothetical protein
LIEKRLWARWALDVFSPASFRRVLRGSVSTPLAALSEFAAVSGARGSVFDVVQELSAGLNSHYRNEYVYKNLIANKILLGRHGLGAAMLSEFRVAGSVADAVVVNGRATVYEVKTELDSSSKLAKQLDDYYRAFSHVNVVVHHSLADRYAELLEDSPVGLIALTARRSLSMRREATGDTSRLEIPTMMKVLRRSEYTGVLSAAGIEVPKVPPIHFFRACAELSEAINPSLYLKLSADELRKRHIKEGEMASRREFESFRYQILQLNPSRRQLESSLDWLRETVA